MKTIFLITLLSFNVLAGEISYKDIVIGSDPISCDEEKMKKMVTSYVDEKLLPLPKTELKRFIDETVIEICFKEKDFNGFYIREKTEDLAKQKKNSLVICERKGKVQPIKDCYRDFDEIQKTVLANKDKLVKKNWDGK